MKKILRYLVFLTLIMITFNVKALEVSKAELTLKPGESDTIELYANIEKEVTSIYFGFTYKSFDVPASFKAADGISDDATNISHNLTFSEPKSGHILLGTITTNVVTSPTVSNATTNITGVTAKTVDSEETINLTGVTITTNVVLPEPTPEELAAKEAEEKAKAEAEAKAKKEAEEKAKAEAEAKAKKEAEAKAKREAEEKAKKEAEEQAQIETTEPIIDTNLLSSIESNIVTIELRPNEYNYSVTIDKEVEELDLKGIAKTPDTEVTVSNQKIAELEDNTITITAKTSDAEQNYIIKVNIKKDVITTTNVDKSYKTKWIVITLFMIISLGVSIIFIKNK